MKKKKISNEINKKFFKMKKKKQGLHTSQSQLIQVGKVIGLLKMDVGISFILQSCWRLLFFGDLHLIIQGLFYFDFSNSVFSLIRK